MFVYSAYFIMALLYKTVPTFKNIWIKCLRDLGRYKIAIKDNCYNLYPKRLDCKAVYRRSTINGRGTKVT